jgi:hypothetical protein
MSQDDAEQRLPQRVQAAAKPATVRHRERRVNDDDSLS